MSEAKSETAFVLPAAAVGGSSEPVHFGGFPGVWTPGEPIAVSELGFATVKEAREAKNDLAADLVEKTVKAGSAPMPAADNHIAESGPPAPLPVTEPEPETAAGSDGEA